jgi:CRP/FNR family transcriptional regulator
MITAEELRTVVAGFDGLPESSVARIAQLTVERRFALNAVLYRAGAEADGLYCILAGRVRVARVTVDRVELLHSEGVGGVLGEIPVFGGGPFPATATAVEQTRCAHLPIEAVRRLVREDPAFAQFALRRLAERARSLLRRIDELSSTTVTARVAAYLLERAGKSSNAEFALGMSQERLASELGTAREVVVRALRALVEAGAIGRAGRSRFEVRNLTLLRAFANR